MTDKYEEFKKWFNNNDEIIWHSVKCNTGFIGSEPFNEFEKELEEKQKENEIKQLIRKITEMTIEHTKRTYRGDLIDNLTDGIFIELKKGGYLHRRVVRLS